jgi:hypothetical protein
MKQFATMNFEADFDVAQTLAMSKLSEGHSDKLIPATKLAGVAIAIVTILATPKIVVGNEAHHLCKYGTALVHRVLLRKNFRRKHRSKKNPQLKS